MKDHYRIDDEIQKLKDTDPDYVAKLRELQKQIEEVGIVPFFDALDQHTGPKGDAELVKKRDRLKELKRELARLDLQPDDRKAKLAERQGLLESSFRSFER